SFLLMTHHPPRPTPFPYTTLFRSAGTIAQHFSQVCLARAVVTDFTDPQTEVGTVDRHLDLGQPSKKLAKIAAHFRSGGGRERQRSEEHTSELQSRSDLVCRLLLEK